jgi:geranylgeranyl diphosphate synthase type I
MAGASLELLQTYLLIHDDWMDEADTRRGAPSAHVVLAETFGSQHKGSSAAILAGDQACALAQEVLLDLPLPAECIVAAVRELARIQQDVIAGQLLDVYGELDDPRAVEQMHDLKTGSYTVRGPLELGALLAGASAADHVALARFARPVGIAFQLRDDLLGTFADPAVTGKPQKPVPWMLARGAAQRVEDRIAGLVDRAVTELATSSFSVRGKTLLAGAANALAYRER